MTLKNTKSVVQKKILLPKEFAGCQAKLGLSTSYFWKREEEDEDEKENVKRLVVFGESDKKELSGSLR